MELKLESVAVLPEQLLEPPAVAEEGELALLWAVLHDALRIYTQCCRMGAYASQDFREADRWIFSNDRSYLTSFENICEAFEIEIRTLRLRLLDLRFPSETGFAKAS